MKKILTTMLCAAIGFGTATWAKAPDMVVTSPDGKLKTVVKIENNNLVYSVSHEGTPVVTESTLGMTLTNGKKLGLDVKNPKVKMASMTIDKATPFYRKARVNAKCNTMTLNFGKYDVEFVALDRGVAYRFVTRYADSVNVANEVADFNFDKDYMVYQTPVNTNAEKREDQFFNSFERPYNHASLTKLDTKFMGQGPCVVELGDGKKLALTDYNAIDYPGMFLAPIGAAKLDAVFAPVPKKEINAGYNGLQPKAVEFKNYIARVPGKFTFPWRMLIVTTNDGQLIDCDVPYLLGENSVLKDISWIRPGKAQWDWWHAWNVKGVDFRAGINTTTYKYYIDYAAKNKVEYIVIDDGWSPQNDLMSPIKELDLPELVKYGRERGVDIVLWAMGTPFHNNMEAVCKKYSAMGIKGFKIDFFDRNDQKMAQTVESIVKTCAKYKLVVDLHGIFPPNGLQQKYPNLLNFEGVHGLEQVKWQPASVDAVTHETILPFARTITGPMDYTQGAMRNAAKGNYYPCNTQPMSMGTRCRQLAEYVIFDSPFSMMSDAPTSYQENQECADYIAAVPTVWDEIRVLDAKIGEYIVEARRKGNAWYVAGITNWTPRDLTVDLSFAKDRKAVIYVDGINADRNAEDYKVETVQGTGSVKIHMAPGGGFAGVIK